jgi:mono/diheme cytochrome c family protein
MGQFFDPIPNIKVEDTIPMKSASRLFSMLLLTAALLPTAAAIQVAGRPTDKADGEALYKQKCAMCHAPDGKGYSAIKTPDFTSPKWQESKTNKEIADTIKNGKSGTAMKSFADQLKEDEIEALVKYIRSLNSAKKK